MPDLEPVEPGVALVDEPEGPEARDTQIKILWELRAIKMALIAAYNLNANDYAACNFIDDIC